MQINYITSKVLRY